MKASIKFTTKLSDTEDFSIQGTGIDQDGVEFLKDVRKLLEKKDAVVKLWREMQDEKTKATKD